MRTSRLPVAVVMVALLVSAGCVDAPVGGQSTAEPSQAAATERAEPSPTDGSDRDYTRLYERTIDSVAMLRVSAEDGVVGGSGFVYDRRGHIVTNAHVVGSAETVEVRFRDGEWHTGTVVGTDVYTDLAVVRVDDPPTSATPLRIAESHPRPGERVVALGSPFGLEGTVTSGIVSGVNRSMRTENGFTIPDTVQTDAAINPGNSGGPLVATDGRVVGVNRARGGENVGFAISAAIVERVVPSLIRRGVYAHAYVGVVSIEVTPVVARANDLDRAHGLLIVGTPAGGPADGVLRPADDQAEVDGVTVPTGGDVVVAVDGRPIGTHQELGRYLALRTTPGQRIELTVIRNGTRRTLPVELGRRPPP